MSFGLPEKTIILLREFFSKYSEIEKVKIYGSRALGNYEPGSDIDFAVYSGRDLTGRLLTELDELPVPYLFDVTDYNTLEHLALKKHIDDFAKIFYEKSNN